MRKILICLLAVCLLMLGACGSSGELPPEPETTAPVTAPTGLPTPPKTPVPETEPEETQWEPLQVMIGRDDFPVYTEPGYDWAPSGTVGTALEHTVVETWEDEEGNLWGRLAAAGVWVDLTRNAAELENMPPVTVCRGNHYRRYEGVCHYCEASTSEYAYLVALSAQEPLRDVSFFSIEFQPEAMRGQELIFVEEWEPGMPLVVNVEFMGSASLFGLEFTDGKGETQIYSLWESGRNGYVEVSPFTEPLGM